MFWGNRWLTVQKAACGVLLCPSRDWKSNERTLCDYATRGVHHVQGVNTSSEVRMSGRCNRGPFMIEMLKQIQKAEENCMNRGVRFSCHLSQKTFMVFVWLLSTTNSALNMSLLGKVNHRCITTISEVVMKRKLWREIFPVGRGTRHAHVYS